MNKIMFNYCKVFQVKKINPCSFVEYSLQITCISMLLAKHAHTSDARMHACMDTKAAKREPGRALIIYSGAQLKQGKGD